MMLLKSSHTMIVSAVFLCTAAFATHCLSNFRYLLTFSDSDCTDLGGEVQKHTKMRVKDAAGNFMVVTVTRCKIPVEEEAKSARPSTPSTSESLKQIPCLKSFVKIVETSGMAGAIDKEQDVTVLAPSDKALDKLTQEELKELQTDRSAARKFVERHLIPGKRVAFDYTPARGAAKLDAPLTGGDGVLRRITPSENRLRIGDATIQLADIETANGVIHVIDTALNEK
jgi:uncharacterized surface protein with fasciclin (FAS1) repeats